MLLKLLPTAWTFEVLAWRATLEGEEGRGQTPDPHSEEGALRSAHSADRGLTL